MRKKQHTVAIDVLKTEGEEMEGKRERLKKREVAKELREERE